MARKPNYGKIKPLIDLFRKKVEEKGVVGAKYYLFGSWASGRQNENSDIDLCVVSEDFGKNSFRESTFLRLLTIGIDEMLEPVAMSPEDFEDRYNTLAVEIKKTGIKIL